MSRCLTERSIDHVVLERGEVANSWKTERWDSLRLLTPNWQSRLPGYRYQGDDPDGYRTMPETVAFLEWYAQRIAAPVHAHTTVTRVRRSETGYAVETDRGEWRTRTLVLASGACNIPSVPAFAPALPQGIAALTPMQYRNPGQLEQGGVLVVGASATGVQLADEIQRSGREVTLAVGEHIRVPRRYRGRDIVWWMDTAGVQDQAVAAALLARAPRPAARRTPLGPAGPPRRRPRLAAGGARHVRRPPAGRADEVRGHRRAGRARRRHRPRRPPGTGGGGGHAQRRLTSAPRPDDRPEGNFRAVACIALA